MGTTFTICKPFTPRALNQFKSFDGKQFLSMKRKDLVAILGKEEGSRLEGQITICRKTTGFMTASTELRDILAKAKTDANHSIVRLVFTPATACCPLLNLAPQSALAWLSRGLAFLEESRSNEGGAALGDATPDAVHDAGGANCSCGSTGRRGIHSAAKNRHVSFRKSWKT